MLKYFIWFSKMAQLVNAIATNPGVHMVERTHMCKLSSDLHV